MLYFDHSATTPPHPDVTAAIREVLDKYYGNPSSIHKLGLEAERLMGKARQVIASQLKVKLEEVVFTSGGTESNNLAIKGVAYQYRERGQHLITTEIEHASVYQCFKQLETLGFEVTYLPVNNHGKVEVQTLKQAIRKDTTLVSIMHVNNVIGTIQPIEEIANCLKEYPMIKFHVDAVQSIGKIPVSFNKWGIDLMSISAHKLQGPKGAGILVRKQGLQLQPLLVGGSQEFSLRAGTENVPFIVGMAKAIRLAMEKQPEKTNHLYQLRSILEKQIIQTPQFQYNGAENEQDTAPHIIHFSFPGTRAEVIVHALEELGFYVSTQSACSSTNIEPSRVLLAVGADDARAVSGIRISLSEDHQEQDVNKLCNGLKQIVSRFK